MSDRRGYHDCVIETLEKELETSAANGVADTEAATKLARDGPNELHKPKPPTLLMLFLAQLVNVIMVLLICSACASLTIAATGSSSDDAKSYVEGIAIFVIVILNAGIAAVTENVANSALEALSKMSQASCRVIRNGEEKSIACTSVVVGDVVVLQVGDIVPADLRMIDANELKVNEMLLTGEPDDVPKTHKIAKKAEDDGGHAGGEEKLTPITMSFSSCLVTNGKGTGIVTDIGMSTRVGAIAAMLQDKKGESEKQCFCFEDNSGSMTPLQVSLQELGMKIGYLAIAVCVVVWVVGTALERKDEVDPSKPSWLYMTLIAVTLAVAAIPEGIPLCVTISLSSGSKEMVKRNVLVRRLAAVETLGSASVICTDKTGTLTEGKMTMVKMWSAGSLYDISSAGFDPHVGKVYPSDSVGDIPHSISGMNRTGSVSMISSLGDEQSQIVAPSQEPGNDKFDSGKSEKTVRSTLLAGLLCCNTTIAKDPETGLWKPKGNSSEAPIVVAAAKVGFWEDQLSNQFKRCFEIPFNSSRKMMVTVTEVVDGTKTLGENGIDLPEGTKYIVVVKGAPNIILDACKDWTVKSGGKEPFTEKENAQAMDIVDRLSSQALRVLAVAIRCLPELPFDLKDENITTDEKFQQLVHGPFAIRLMGLVASIDPAREGVKEAVEAANLGGIRVTMITGDYYKTAVAIAKNIKIILPTDNAEETALDCGGLRPGGNYLGELDMDALTSRVKVFARAKPEDKLEIVKSLQRQGLVCAMTGDGVNDAPALKRSDIGVAMGLQGTDVAKGASDMILTDDNFVSIVGAVERGRVIYAGIQKFVAFIMSVHIGEVMQIFFCVVAGIPIMRRPLQILFLILVTDLPPAVALGMEPGSKTIMRERPRTKTQPIVLKWMWQSIVINGLILSSVVAVVYIIALQRYCDMINQEDISAAIEAQKNIVTCGQSRLDSDCNFEKAQKDLTLRLDDKYLLCMQQGQWTDSRAETCGKDEDTQSMELRLRIARTATFIAVVFAENIRAYTSRSFDQPFYLDLCSNIGMQKAITIAQVALWFVVFVPGLSDTIFELEGIKTMSTDLGFLLAVIAAVGCLLLCEIYKMLVKKQIKAFADRVRAEEEEAGRAREEAVRNRVSLVTDQPSGIMKLASLSRSQAVKAEASPSPTAKPDKNQV